MAGIEAIRNSARFTILASDGFSRSIRPVEEPRFHRSHLRLGAALLS
jgi:hypothetical protein